MALTPITNHVEAALNRLIEQYKESQSIKDLFEALVQEFQNLEDAGIPLCDRLDVNAISGENLDKFGEIVDIGRNGLDDQAYRLFLLGKIGVNVSEGEPERIISTWKILTAAAFVHYMNLNSASIELATDGEIPAGLENLAYNLITQTVAAGVRIDGLIFSDPDCIFAFAGPNTAQVTQGFGTLADPLVGGCFSWLVRPTPDFAFDGDNSDLQGFGTVQDPIVGGIFNTL